MNTELKNKEVAKKMNELTSRMHNVQVSCNAFDNLVLFGKIEDVQKVAIELAHSGLTILENNIPSSDNPYFNGQMVAIVGRL
jgi:hypothetical protein